MKSNYKTKPLVVHVIYRLTTGGLENGLVNLINNVDQDLCRHAVICMTNSDSFRERIKRKDVTIYELNKKSGNDLIALFKLWKLLVRLKPVVLHSRNIGTIDAVLIAFLARVPIRLHGEHGRDMLDIDGSNVKYKYVRKLYHPFIYKFITMSKDLSSWLEKYVGINKNKIVQIYNGVDTKKFRYKGYLHAGLRPGKFIVGTVGQLRPEKNQLALVKAVKLMMEKYPELQDDVELRIIGEGPCYKEISEYVNKHCMSSYVWLAGARSDINVQLLEFDIFVLPSRGEGISNTILEAMCTGLPIVATDVGGNPELVVEGETGMLVESNSETDIMHAIYKYIQNPKLIKVHGENARERVESHFSLDRMVNDYSELYSSIIKNTSI